MRISLVFTISFICLTAASLCWASKVSSAPNVIEVAASPDLDLLSRARQRLRLDPDDKDARLDMSSARIELGWFDAAIAELELIDHGGLNEGRRLQLLATAYTRLSRYRDLLSKIQVGQDFTSDTRATLYARRAYAYIRLGEPASVDIALASAREAAKENWAVGKAGVSLLIDAGDFQAADDFLSELLKRWPQQKELRLQQAQVTSRLQLFAESAFIYKTLQQEFPADRWLYWQATSALVRDAVIQQEYPRAEALIGEMLYQDPSRLYANYLGAVVAQLAGNNKLALDRVARVLKKVPGHRLAQELIGKIYFHDGLYRQAEFYLSKVVAREPENLQFRLFLAETYFGLNEVEIGLTVLQNAPENQSEAPQLLYLRGIGSMTKKAYEDGFRYLNRILELYPDRFESVRVVVLAELEFGDPGRAISLLNQWLTRHIDDADARLLLSRAWNRKGDPQRALDMALPLQNQLKNNVEILLYIGWLYQALGNYSQSEIYYARVEKIAPGVDELIYARARLQEEKGMHQAASASYLNMLGKNKSDLRAMMGVLRIAIAQNEMEETLYWLAQIRASSLQDVDSRVMLANYYLKKGRYTEVHALARELLVGASQKEASILVDVLAQIGEARYHEAIITLSKALGFSQNKMVMQTLLAQSQLLFGDAEKADEVIVGMLQKNPDYVPAIALFIEAQRDSGNDQHVQRASQKLKELGVELPADINIKDPLAFISLVGLNKRNATHTPLEQLVFGGLRVVFLDELIFKKRLGQTGATLLNLDEKLDAPGSLLEVLNSEFLANLYKEKREQPHFFDYNEFQVDFWDNYFSIGLVDTEQARVALKKVKKEPPRVLRKPGLIALAALAILLLVLVFRRSDRVRKVSAT